MSEGMTFFLLLRVVQLVWRAARHAAARSGALRLAPWRWVVPSVN